MKSTNIFAHLLNQERRRLIGLIVRFFSPYWVLVLALVSLSFIASVLTSFSPLALSPVLEIAQQKLTPPASSLFQIDLNNFGPTLLQFLCPSCAGNALEIIIIVAITFVTVSALAALSEFSTHLISNYVAGIAARDMQSEMYKNLLRQNVSFFTKSKVGELSNRFVFDVGEATNDFDLIIRHVLQSLIQIAIYGWLLFATSAKLAIATLIVSLCHVAITKGLSERLRRSSKARFNSVGTIGALVGDGLVNIRTIKSIGSEDYEYIRFSRTADEVLRTALGYFRSKHIESPLRRVADALAIGVVLVLAVAELLDGDISTSGFLMFIAVARITMVPLSTLAQAVTRLDSSIGPGLRILEVLEAEDDIRNGRRTDVTFTTSLSFENVAFSHAGGVPVLSDVCLELRPRESVALVGPSGAGKSTVLDLLLRFHDPSSGRITLDGINIREFHLRLYRTIFGVVNQEPLLFHSTIFDNIVCGRSGFRFEDVKRAALIAHAHDFICTFPEQYHTIVGDRGVRLSGGQRQRVALTRALLGNPKILLLDEATSALDADSESSVQSALDEAMQNAATFIVTHRVSTASRADRIVVISEGAIEASGAHSELLIRSPTYKRMWQLQSASSCLASEHLPPG